MKSRTVIALAALAAVLAIALAGCVLAPITIEGRLTRFIDGLNAADRGSVYFNFSSTETVDYEAIKPALYWDTPFPAGTEGDLPYSFATTIDPSDPTAVLVTIAGPPLFGGPKDFKFVMVNEPTGVDNWMIHELWIWSTDHFEVLIQ
jgi:hypothetical protein